MAPFDKRVRKNHNLSKYEHNKHLLQMQFHFVINLAVGGNFFPDACVNGAYPKPWSYASSTQMKNFWEKRANWLPTWNAATEDGALKIDYIRVYKTF